MIDKNNYKPIEAVVEDVITETSNIKTIVFKTKEKFSFSTGQFVEITIPGIGGAPFTPSSNPAKTDKFDVTIMKVGRVTDKVHQLKKGDIIGVRGPFGAGYPLKDFKGKEVLIVGGGEGLAPLRSLLFALFNEIDDYKRLVVKFGSRSPSDIVFKNAISDWQKNKNTSIEVGVDKGDQTWKGKVGLVTTLLDGLDVDIKNSVAIVCGPPIMMKFTTLKLIGLGYQPSQIYLSMEKNMSCGFGKCGHCRLGNFYCCKDGPVFSYDRIKDFEEVWD